MKRKIKVKFVDYYKKFDPENSFIMECLRRKYDIEYSEQPDYLFFSSFGLENLDYRDCIKIFYSGENHFPDFNLCDYAMGFEWIDVGDRYFHIPTFYQTVYKSSFEKMVERTKFTGDDLKKKEGFCSFVYSNAEAAPIRYELFKTLSTYKQVASGGRFMNNIGGPCDSKIDFERKYKFSIAVENVAYPGYTTEKLMQAFAADTIPIYWGDPEVTKIFNPKAFIHVRDYDSIDAVLNKVKELDQDNEKYLQMMMENPLIDKNYNRENMLSAASDFLYHVIDQDLEQAKRFSRICWNKFYTDQAIERRNAKKLQDRNIINRLKRKIGK